MHYTGIALTQFLSPMCHVRLDLALYHVDHYDARRLPEQRLANKRLHFKRTVSNSGRDVSEIST